MLTLLPGLLAPLPAAALELRGQTLFVTPPWDLGLITYNSNVWGRPTEYYLTLVMPAEAGADLARLTVQQVRGVDREFPFDVERTRAFLGRPRREGAAVAVQARFDEDRRLFNLEFPRPVAPGQVLTVVLRPWANPSQADVYQFSVVATPAGVNPVASPVGTADLRIYSVDF